MYIIQIKKKILNIMPTIRAFPVNTIITIVL